MKKSNIYEAAQEFNKDYYISLENRITKLNMKLKENENKINELENTINKLRNELKGDIIFGVGLD